VYSSFPHILSAMHRLAVVALTLLVIFASVLPTVLARETNGQRFKRGSPPLPPSRREVAKRQKPSSAPQTVTGFVQARDASGAHTIGYLEDQPSRLPLIGLVSSQSQALQATFSGSGHTLQATVPAYSFLGLGSSGTPSVFTDLTKASGSDASIWSYNPATGELTVKSAQFAFDVVGDDIEIVTDWAAYEAEQTEPANKLPQQVRLYLVT